MLLVVAVNPAVTCITILKVYEYRELSIRLELMVVSAILLITVLEPVVGTAELLAMVVMPVLVCPLRYKSNRKRVISYDVFLS